MCKDLIKSHRMIVVKMKLQISISNKRSRILNLKNKIEINFPPKTKTVHTVLQNYE